MIHIATGNIFESAAEAIVNTVNTQGVMGKGIALQCKQNYPHNYSLYRKACLAGEVRTGRMFVVEEGDMAQPHRLIINFPTKERWQNPSQYSYIAEGLESLRAVIADRGIRSVAIPPLGCGNGGLDWPKVKAMIVEALGGTDCDITLYEPAAHIAAQERKERVRLTPARAMLLRVMADAESQGQALSEFAAEKIAYFLQKNGAEEAFRLTFNKGHYGPYSGKVRHVLRQMNGSYVMGMSDLSNRPFDEIFLTRGAAAEAQAYLALPQNRRYKEIADETAHFLDGFYTNYLLELLATISFLGDTDPRMESCATEAEASALIGEDLMEWSGRKVQLFNQENAIRLALGHIRKMC